MPKFIFILFLFFCSLNVFSQNDSSNATSDKSKISAKKVEKEKMEVVIRDLNETEIELLFKDNLCEILSIKTSDFLNESMLKKLKANV